MIDQDRHCGPVEIGSTSVTLKVVMMVIVMTILMMMTMMVMIVMVMMIVMMMMMTMMVMITMISGSKADRARPGQVLLLPDPQPT